MNLMSSLHTVFCRQNADLRRLKIILNNFLQKKKLEIANMYILLLLLVMLVKGDS